MSQLRKPYNPPRFADRFLSWFCKDELLEEVKGDLHEFYELESQGKSRVKVNLKYWFHVLHFVRPFALKRHSTYQINNIMVTNNLKIGFRNMMKHKGFSLIHILGLVMGITSSLFILTYVDSELNVDQFHKNKQLVYRVDTDIKAGDTFLPLAVASGAMGPAFRNEFPEVVDYLRMSRSWGPLLVKYEQQAYFESKVMYAEHTFFKLFDFELQQGSREKALEGPFKVVLSAELARKYFGEKSPLGEFLEIKDRPYQVTGVLADKPLDSHLDFDMLLSFQSWINDFPTTETNWGWKPTTTYVLLTDVASSESLALKFPEFVDKYMATAGNEVKTDLSLTSLEQAYFGSSRLGDIGVQGNKKQLYLLMSAAFLIIILALSNFINLSSARASTRMKEVGIRKVAGAHRIQLVTQFFSEAFIFTFLALAISIGLFALLLPGFSEVVGKTFELQTYWTIEILGALVLLGITLGVLAGAYPAILISSFKPIDALKNKLNTGKTSISPRKVMTTFQFFISIGLLIVAVVMWKQFQLIESKDLGFYKDQTIVVDMGQNPEVIGKHRVIKDELIKTGFISGLSFSSHAPGEKPHSLTTRISLEGEQRSAEILLNIVDQDFINNYQLTLIAGRDFSSDIASDTVGAMILNETALSYFGLSSPEEAIGLDFNQWGGNGKVIGVVKDFHYQSLHEEIEPLSLRVWPAQFRKASIKINSNSFQAGIAGLSDKWLGLTNEPFNYSFLDDRLNRLYTNDQRFGSIFRLFTILALAIACLGLVGLSSFVVKLKTKELAIRKVLGAGPMALLVRLLKEFGLPVMLGLVLAVAPAYLFLKDWLGQFAYRVELLPVYLILPALIIIMLVAISVLYQSAKVVFENPTNSLRDE